MKYVIQKTNDLYLHDTKVENIFINEYMPVAPGDYVKVFLYACMYAENRQPMSNEEMANQLNIDVRTVEEAWDYWESMLAIKKHKISSAKDDYVIEFLELKAMLYGSGEIASNASVSNDTTNSGTSNPLGNDELKLLLNSIEQLMGRPLETKEVQKIIELHEDFSMAVSLIEYGFKYSINRGKKNFNYAYAVLNNWVKSGVTSIDEAEGFIEENDEKRQREKRVMKALGFNRTATETEEKMLDHWFDELGFNMDKVLEACSKTSGISAPNFNYINKVLENWYNDSVKEKRSVNEPAAVSRKVLNDYYDYLRQKAENDAEERKREIYDNIPEIEEIDKKINMLGAKISRSMIIKDSSVDANKLKTEMDHLIQDRAILLTESNYEMDYTEVKYACEICKDTGMTDEGAPCICIEERRQEASNWQKQHNL